MWIEAMEYFASTALSQIKNDYTRYNEAGCDELGSHSGAILPNSALKPNPMPTAAKPVRIQPANVRSFARTVRSSARSVRADARSIGALALPTILAV